MVSSVLYGVGGQCHVPSVLPREGTPEPIVQKAGWAPEPVWTATENLVANKIRSPDRPGRSKSLYRLRYPGPQFCTTYDWRSNILQKQDKSKTKVLIVMINSSCNKLAVGPCSVCVVTLLKVASVCISSVRHNYCMEAGCVNKEIAGSNFSQRRDVSEIALRGAK